MNGRMIRGIAAVIGMMAAASPVGGQQLRPVPANLPGEVSATDSTVILRYGGAVLFEGRLRADRGVPRLRQLVDTAGGRVTQLLSWVSRAPMTLTGTVHGPGDAFAVDADPREDGVPVVRNSVGPSYSLLNRGVYDRDGDWLLSVDFPADVKITPVAGNDSAAFSLEADGGEVTLRFRPRFYQKHRGLSHFEPWTYQPWPTSMAGWTSWFAFKDKVTEGDVHRAADVVAERLKPFGYDVIQIDDGFQQNPISVPDHWLNTNAKFPAGLAGLQRYIAGRGLTAGLWTNTTFADSAWAAQHPQYFVRAADGRPARGNWVGYVMDGANPATMSDLVLPVYRALKSGGWQYFKVDALRHLRYEGYNSHAGFYTERGIDRVAVYRSFVQQIRDVIGRDAFLLASWGPRPELAGIIDATRLGDDGFGYGAFSQFNSFNNVVWRNDPDHIEVHQPDGFRAATLASLTGSLVMLTDRPEVFLTDRVEAARRVAPVLVTRPGQVYDVDPTRTDRLYMVEHEVSGGGPRPFEADQRLQQTLYQLDLARPFERWTVLARTAGAPATVGFADLGLPMGRDYVAFDFWAKRFLGVMRDSLTADPVSADGVQVICLRERVDHPQLLATNRHVSCGGVDLETVRWDGASLSGISNVVGGDDYTIHLTQPAGWVAADVQVEPSSPATRMDGARLGESSKDPVSGLTVRQVIIRSSTSKALRWRINFRKAG